MIEPHSTGPRRYRNLSLRRIMLMGSAAVFAGVLMGSLEHSLPAAIAAPVAPAQAAEAVHQPADFADLIAKVKPAVISVRVKIEEDAQDNPDDQQDSQQDSSPLQPGSPMEKFFQQFGQNFGRGRQFNRQPERRSITGEGSGFFITSDGYAVTNYHVVDHAKTVTVTTDDGKIHSAKVLGTDQRSDLALIKVDGSGFDHVSFADHAPRIGEWAVAVGNPFGLGGTVTAGIVSATGRDIGEGIDDYIQIDAPINRGNSGGPTFDTSGEVIGINTAIYSPSGGSVGIGFDIPAATAKNIIAQLKDSGHVTRGWLGVQIQPVTAAVADALGLKQARGALVDDAQSGSPAEKAGVKAGDVIVAINGTEIKDSRDLAQKIANAKPGSSVKLDAMRDGNEKTFSLTLGQVPTRQTAQARSDQNKPNLGLTLAPASEAGVNGPGVVITSVDPNGVAADQGIQSGDVIVNVDGKPVSKPGDVQSELNRLHKDGKHTVLMRLKSGKSVRYVALPIANG
jgi:serine protease Do